MRMLEVGVGRCSITGQDHLRVCIVAWEGGGQAVLNFGNIEAFGYTVLQRQPSEGRTLRPRVVPRTHKTKYIGK